MKENWLPLNHLVSPRIHLRKLLNTSQNWQIYESDNHTRTLVVTKWLVDQWIEKKLLDSSLVTDLKFGSDEYFAIHSGTEYQLAPIVEFKLPSSKEDALAFAFSLKLTREIVPDVSLHDAIYVERYSRLLPTWTVSEKVDDELVLGSWLTGGVTVSTNSHRRLSTLLGWLDQESIDEIIESAGLKTVHRDVQVAEPTQNKENVKAKKQEKEKEKEKIDSEEVAEKPSKFELKGNTTLQNFFNEYILDVIMNEERYKVFGVDFPAGVILHGPPGCGKTFAVEKLVEFLDWPVYKIDPQSIGSPYIHETSRKVSEVFDEAIEHSPSVIVIDEMESYLADRQHDGGTGLHHVEEVAEFLRRIPEAISSRVLIIAMTNRLDMIDDAIRRRGRFDHIIEVSMPSKVEIQELVDSILEKIPVSGDISIDGLVETLEDHPLSDVTFVLREAGRIAARSGKTKLDQEHIDNAVKNLPAETAKSKMNPIGFTWS